jgi:hypothetical protein
MKNTSGFRNSLNPNTQRRKTEQSGPQLPSLPVGKDKISIPTLLVATFSLPPAMQPIPH